VEPKAQAPTEYIPEKPIEVEAEPVGELSPLVSGPGTTESEQDDAFKWLENLAAGQGAKSEELLTKPEERAERAPGWVGEVENPPTELSALISGPGTSSSEQDDALLWLESLAQKQGAKPEELITNPEARKENAPDWVGQVGQVPDQVVEPKPVQETAPPPPVEEVKPQEPPAVRRFDDDGFVPGPLSELVSGPGTSEAEQDDALLWLESLAQKQGAKPEELITKPEERKDLAPDWVAQVGQEPAGSAEPTTPVETPAVLPSDAQSDESLAWLQGLAGEGSLAAEQPSEQSPMEQQPADEDWMKGLEAAAGPTAGAAADESLDWLNSLGKPAEETPPAMGWDQPEQPAVPPTIEPQAVEPPAETAAVADESLDWLNSLGKPVEETPPEMGWDQPEQPAVPLTPEPQAVEPPVETTAVADESLDWLNSLGNPTEETPPAMGWDQPEQPAVPLTPEPQAVEPPAAVAASADESLEWLNSLGQPADEMPSSQPEQPVVPSISEPQAIESDDSQASSETPDWLASFGEANAQEQAEVMPWEQEPPVEPAQPETLSDEQPEAAEQETPDVSITQWLKNLDVQEQAAAVEKPAAENEELPDWLKDTSADEQPPMPEPVQGWIPTDEIPAQPPAETEMPVSSRLPQEEAPPSAPVAESVPPLPLPQRPSIRQTGMLGGDKDSLAVQRARDLLGRGGLDGAMSEYTKLIKRGKLLEDVIYDLQEAVYSHPVDVVVWQTLGDAYMRSNRLQDALDAYSKAEELLR
jgi:hypothetical protein